MTDQQFTDTITALAVHYHREMIANFILIGLLALYACLVVWRTFFRKNKS